MHPRALKRHLQQVKADLALGYEHLSKQRQIVVDLQKGGQDARFAEESLREAEETQAIYVAETARLDKELATATQGVAD